jgi:hypothetical protein
MKAKVRDVGRVPKSREARSLGWRQYDARAQITTRAFDDEEQEYSMSVIGPPDHDREGRGRIALRVPAFAAANHQ